MKAGDANSIKNQNKLIGWLVSYQQNSRGSYYELREGRAFLGSGVVQGERLIGLDAKEFPGIHAVLKASPVEGVMVQDIFSSTGTYLSKVSSGEEQSVSGPTPLEHGDWIRFGDNLRFQVCLIDGGSR